MSNIITDKRWELKLQPIRKKPENKELLRLLTRWQNNTNENNLGIIRFGFEMFNEQLNPKYGLADWVRPAFSEVLNFNKTMDKTDRSHAICTYRDGSKSTWFAFVLPLYYILVGQYGIYWEDQLHPLADYIRLRGKNQDEAEKRLANVTSEFSNNDLLIKLFGDLEPTLQEVKTRKLKAQAKLLMLRNGHILQGQGINQPSRGANLRGKRPKVDINDDIENKENTKTPTARQWNAKEILGEQYGGLDPQGLTVYIGNIVHKQCLLMSFLKTDPQSKFYRGNEEAKANEEVLRDGFGNVTHGAKEFRPWKTQYYQATYFDRNGIERSNWTKRLPLAYMRNLERWYSAHPDIGGRKIFRMEYYNEIVSDKNIPIVLKPVILEKKLDPIENLNVNYIKVFDPIEGNKTIPAYVVVSGDPAISQEKKSSDRSIIVTAFGSDRKRYILDSALGKFDIRDRFYDPQDRMKIKLAQTPEDMGLVQYRGMVEEMARKIIRWRANAFVLENAGQQLAWYNDLKALLKLIGYPIPGLAYHPTDEKVYKLETGLMNWWEADKYVIAQNCNYASAIADAIRTFPEGNLDILDAMFNAEKMGANKIPKPQELSRINNEMVRPYMNGNTAIKIDEPYILY